MTVDYRKQMESTVRFSLIVLALKKFVGGTLWHLFEAKTVLDYPTTAVYTLLYTRISFYPLPLRVIPNEVLVSQILI